MTISGVSSNLSPLIQSALDINKQLDDLNQQLGTGLKADTYAGLGTQGGVAVALNSQLSAINSYDGTMTTVGTTLSLQQQVLQQIASVGSTVQTTAGQPDFTLDNTGQTSQQEAAANQLDAVLSALNTQGGNGYLFSGLGVNQAAVDTADHILNGNGAQAGLEQVIAERLQADQGADGLCRLVISAPTTTSLSVAEDAANSPFGLKLASVNSTLTNATVSGPTGSPPAISVDMSGGNPNDGDTISFAFNLPDGTTQTVQLQATTATSPGANQFAIGATPAATEANLQAALTAAVTNIGQTTMPAASAVAASDNFFDDPPQRVNGAPATATSLVNGTPANTVFWYTGDNSAASIRSTATARVGSATTVSYGTQANEQGIRTIVQNIATLAATTYSASDPNASASYNALTSRLYTNLSFPSGTQNITDIEASLANAQTVIQSTQAQNQQTSNMLTNMLQSIQNADQTQVGAEILSLQTSLSASLSATARMAQLNLVTYLSPVTG
ncbi:MAG TPA: flagellar biosynthesis protein FlgL [Pseudolabrys sp.]|nr:flagellar biosynthesis protein FlgL [Pseudolabrys sp.]